MIYYPLSVLLLTGLQDILIITTSDDLPRFRDLLGDGSALGIRLSYAIQRRPEGIAQALVIAKEYIASNNICMILGDNIFYGHGLYRILQNAVKRDNGCLIFGFHVKDPERYGVVEFDDSGRVLSIEEKPIIPRSRYAVAGLYFFDNTAVNMALSLKHSSRGELEIADVIREYLRQGSLSVELLNRGFAWLDTGTPDSLLEAGKFIETIEKRQGLKVACIEEVAYRMGYIDAERLRKNAERYRNNGYGQYLLQLVNE